MLVHGHIAANMNEKHNKNDAAQILHVLRVSAIYRVCDVASRLGFPMDAVKHLVRDGQMNALGAGKDVKVAFGSAHCDELAQNPMRKKRP